MQINTISRGVAFFGTPCDFIMIFAFLFQLQKPEEYASIPVCHCTGPVSGACALLQHAPVHTGKERVAMANHS